MKTGQKTAAISKEVRSYLEDILVQSGITTVYDATKEDIILELFIKFDDFLIERVVDYVPVDKLGEFCTFMQQSPSKEQVDTFLKSNVPNIQEVYIVAFSDFRKNYLQG
ncbi:MAG TPA: hypothetical protein VGT05_00185 [Patescibacteria group bacterium]|nr:hypothetical protein [Patescibacteria group bacterium]